MSEIENNNLNGWHTYQFNDGTKYVGMWKNGKRDGKGTLYLSDPGLYNEIETGVFYRGDWKDDKLHGLVTITKNNREIFSGYYKNGNRYEGIETYATSGSLGKFLKESYEGKWKDNQYHGQGKYTWLDGRVFEGKWKNGKSLGEGNITYPDGRKEKGKFVDKEFIKSN